MQQGSQSVMEYHKEFLYLMDKDNIKRSPEVLMDRFLFGLREEHADTVQHYRYTTMDDLVKLAIDWEQVQQMIDRHNKRNSSTPIFHSSSKSEMEEFVEYTVEGDVSLEDSIVQNFSTGFLGCEQFEKYERKEIEKENECLSEKNPCLIESESFERKDENSSQSVMEYHKEFLYLMNKANIKRSPEIFMERFLFGLREELADTVQRYRYTTMDDLVKLAINWEQVQQMIDSHNKRNYSTPIFHSSSKPEMEEFIKYAVEGDVSLEDSTVQNFSTGSLGCFVDSLVNYGGINRDEKEERQIAHLGQDGKSMLQQGSQSVMEYHKEFLYLMDKDNIKRSPEVLMDRFLFGLREEHADTVQHYRYTTMDDLVKLAIDWEQVQQMIDRHNKRNSSTPIFHSSSKSEMEEFVEYTVEGDVSLEDSIVQNFSTGLCRFIDQLWRH
ncbi:hypothetical protein Ahy_B03g064878 [Arachis hypogaea]|uniref:Retrotransposon gag domain-containing protein n=1 Tax=Arachis hypogaea TaxID=3818 RepID=A0A445A0J4_ARAHY|nr:hypothetical protein Ahy_B03g064878 [Arachis hypogaea]